MASRGRRAQAVLSAVMSVLLAATMVVVAPRTAQADGRNSYGFTDIAGDEWFAIDEVLGYATEHKFFNGYSDGRFGPYDTVVRGQVATVLHNMAGSPQVESDDFEDVNYDAYYGDAIRWARSTGVINGYVDADGQYRNFGPDDPVTREQLAVMLASYARVVGGKQIESDCAQLDAMPDAGDVSDWARIALGWAMDNGLMSGVSVDGVSYVQPQGTAQRCQAAKMVSALHRNVLGGGGNKEGIEYKDDVKVVESGWSGSASTGITVPEGSAAADAKAGDVIVFEPTATNPFGAALKVSGTQEAGSATKLLGSTPSVPDFADSVKAKGTTSSVMMMEPAADVDIEDAGLDDFSSGGDALGIQAARETVKLGTYKFSLKKYGISVSFKPSVDYNLDYGWGKVKELKVVLKGETEISGNLKSLKNKIEVPLCEAYFATAVPGVFFKADIVLTASVSADASIAISSSAQVGFAYKDGKSSGIFKTSGDNLEISTSATAKAGIGAGLDRTVLAAELAGINLDFGLKLKAGAPTIRESGLVCFDVANSGYADVGLKFGNDIIGYSWSKELADIPIGAVHIENGKWVAKCTWKEPTPGGGGAGQAYTPVAELQYSEDYDGGMIVGGYTGNSDTIVIPPTINGKKVTSVEIMESIHIGSDGTIFGKPLSYIDVTNCKGLRYFITKFTGISKVDFSKNANLEGIYISNEPNIDSVDVSNNLKLTNLSIGSVDGIDCRISRLDITRNSNLKVLECTSKKITSLDLSHNAKLEYLDCSSCSLTSLDLSNNRELISLDCGDNHLSSLDVSMLSRLDHLMCEKNSLSSLDISHNAQLKYLSCCENNISDTSALDELTESRGISAVIYPQL